MTNSLLSLPQNDGTVPFLVDPAVEETATTTTFRLSEEKEEEDEKDMENSVLEKPPLPSNVGTTNDSNSLPLLDTADALTGKPGDIGDSAQCLPKDTRDGNDTMSADGTTTTTASTTPQSANTNSRDYDSPPTSPQTPQRHPYTTSPRFLSPPLSSQPRHSFSTWDDNNIGNSPGSVRSYSSQSTTGRRSLALSRPAGMRERMQQRLRTAQSERNLLASPRFQEDGDDQTSVSTGSTLREGISSSRRRRQSSGGGARMTLQSPLSLPSSSTRERLSQSLSNLPYVGRIMETSTTTTTTPRKSTETNDDTLLLQQLSQKVYQLEEEKEQVEQKQKEMKKKHDLEVRRLRAKLKQEQTPPQQQPAQVDADGTTGTTTSSSSGTKPSPSMTSSLSAASAMLELQAKLDKAMLKISRLEQEQAHRDDLEDKYHDAQMMIANLRLQAAANLTTTSNANSTGSVGRRLSSASAGTTQSLLSDSQNGMSEEREGTLFPPMMFNNDYEGQEPLKTSDSLQPYSSSSSLLLVKDDGGGRPRAGSVDDNATTTTTTSSNPPLLVSESAMALLHDDDTDDNDELVVQHNRSQKLQKLKDFRKSRESQLKELVLDSQISPTDVQSVIRNLQDELKVAKRIIEQQKLQLTQKQLPEQRTENNPTNAHKNVVQGTKTTTTALDTSSIDNNDDNRVNNELSNWKVKYRALQDRYVKLEMDRAWSEFQLRDRITADALKFHKRLRHWKEQTEDLQRQLEETMEQHAKETKDLRVQLSRQEQIALVAEQDLHEYKRGVQQTLQDYSVNQERLAKATALLAKYHPERSNNHGTTSGDPTIMQQAQFVEIAKERKEGKSASWSAGWIGMMRQRVGEPDPAIMG